MIQTTNYLSPELHYVLKESVIRTPYFTLGRPPIKQDRFTFLLDVLYGSGLRVSEGLRLTKEDFHLNEKILIIKSPKTNKKGIQKTTILPYQVATFEKMLERYTLKDSDLVFPISRMTVWQYCKDASIMAGLPIAEEQEEKSINGVWTHLFRKSCSKRMANLGASRELRMRKLRHAFKDAHDTYDAVDINTLKDWEMEHFD